MFTAFWRLLTNEQSFNEFLSGHGAVLTRLLLAAAGFAAQHFGSNSELWWLGGVAQVLALGIQGGDKNTSK